MGRRLLKRCRIHDAGCRIKRTKKIRERKLRPLDYSMPVHWHLRLRIFRGMRRGNTETMRPHIPCQTGRGLKHMSERLIRNSASNSCRLCCRLRQQNGMQLAFTAPAHFLLPTAYCLLLTSYCRPPITSISVAKRREEPGCPRRSPGGLDSLNPFQKQQGLRSAI